MEQTLTTHIEVHEPQWLLYLFMMGIFLGWAIVIGRHAILLILNWPRTRTRMALWVRVGPLLSVAAIGIWGCVRTTLREGALRVEIGTAAARLHYRWSTETIPYREIESLMYRDAHHRRGLRIHEARLTASNDAHRIWAISNDAQSVAAVRKVFEELSKHVPKERTKVEAETKSAG